uniref:Dolichol-phosphate mannosyltransferase subunit 3 n=1 Tax=Arion vulgaris TaxID=1028688 RepID=A0A0B6YRA8_9EUPU
MGITKLFQWLIGVSLFMSVWLAYVVGYIKTELRKEYHEIIIVLPIYLLISFACYSLAVIGYRVSTFNNCEDASKELKEHIQEARKDLEKKKYKYVSDWK